MMMDGAANLRRGVLIPSIAAASAFAVLLSLGVWQLDRKAWKEGLIATIGQRLSAPPVALPAPATWPRLGAAEEEFLQVAVTAEFLNDREALVYTSGSSLREGSSGPGYWVFTPARLADGALVVVNRGFVPDGKQDPAARPDGEVAGPINMVGVLRWPEPPGMFTPAGDPTRNIWFSRDSNAIAAAKGVSVAPFYLELESPDPPGGLPRTGRLHPTLPNNHFGYALTWLGLACVLVGVYGTWLFGSWRKRHGAVEYGA
jgi:surfeit locus 1 family protein